LPETWPSFVPPEISALFALLVVARLRFDYDDRIA
jgi:hypothetical protein